MRPEGTYVAIFCSFGKDLWEFSFIVGIPTIKHIRKVWEPIIYHTFKTLAYFYNLDVPLLWFVPSVCLPKHVLSILKFIQFPNLNTLYS